jgi:hypothetical protein
MILLRPIDRISELIAAVLACDVVLALVLGLMGLKLNLKDRVAEHYDPDRHGTIISAGEEVRLRGRKPFYGFALMPANRCR